jgi:hypothetical protein
LDLDGEMDWKRMKKTSKNNNKKMAHESNINNNIQATVKSRYTEICMINKHKMADWQ